MLPVLNPGEQYLDLKVSNSIHAMRQNSDLQQSGHAGVGSLPNAQLQQLPLHAAELETSWLEEIALLGRGLAVKVSAVLR